MSAPDSCDICNSCIPSYMGKDFFQQASLSVWCQILAAISGGGSGGNVNLTGINGIAPAVGNGLSNTGTLRVVIAQDSLGPVQANINQVGGAFTAVNNGVSTSGTLRVTLASDSTGQVILGAGTNVIGSLVANQSVNVAQVSGNNTAISNGTTNSGTQRVTISSDSTGQVKLNGGSLDPNQSINVAQISGSTTSVGNGVSGTGVQRVTLASDSTGQVTLATGANTIGALTANQSVNQTQWAGNAVNLGNGTTGTGTLRVTISSDSTGQVALAAGSASIGTVVLGAGAATIGALLANQSVNVAQINGVTPLMGNGTTGTGSQRVTISSDNFPVAGFGVGATGSAVPANAVYLGVSDGTNLRGVLQAANALNTTGTGIPTAQIVGQFDDVSPTAITENQFGNLRISANRNLYSTIRDASGSERGVNVNSSNQLSVSVDNSNVSTNIAQWAGNAVNLGNGTTGTGTLRVTISSDSTGQVTLATGANTIGALTANQSVNVAQINGVTTTMGNGVSGTGVQRVTLASDSTGQVTLATGANTIGALTANQSVNVAQVGGSATATNNGTTSAGTQRVTISSDSTGVVGLSTGTNSIGKISDITTSITPGGGAANLGKAEDAASASGDTGVFVLAVRRDAPAQSAGTAGDYCEVNVSNQGGLWASLAPSIGGGWFIDSRTALTNTPVSVKSAAGTFGGYILFNPAAAITYIQVFNVAVGSVTLGTTTPTFVIGIPAGSLANVEFPNGVAMSTAIVTAATTTATGSSAPATAAVMTTFYK